MSDSTTQPRNLEALILGTGEFSFSPGATSLADARAKGYRDFGNIVTVGFKPEVEVVEHEGSYRGVKRVDKRLATKGVLGYGLKCDELTRENLKIALGGSDATAFTQTSKTAVTADALGFTATPITPETLNRWHDVFVSGSRVRRLTALLIAASAGIAATAQTATDTITKNGHALANGTRVIFTGTDVGTAGLTAGTIYFVRDTAENTFKVADTVGGAAREIAADAATLAYQVVLIEGTDYVADLKLGRVRFLTEQNADRYPVVTAPAINDGLLAITPLTNLIQSGYGRITIYDDTHPDKVVYDHVDFSCQVSFEAGADLDGKKVAEIDFKVLVTDVVGTVYTAE